MDSSTIAQLQDLAVSCGWDLHDPTLLALLQSDKPADDIANAILAAEPAAPRHSSILTSSDVCAQRLPYPAQHPPARATCLQSPLLFSCGQDEASPEDTPADPSSAKFPSLSMLAIQRRAGIHDAAELDDETLHAIAASAVSQPMVLTVPRGNRWSTPTPSSAASSGSPSFALLDDSLLHEIICSAQAAGVDAGLLHTVADSVEQDADRLQAALAEMLPDQAAAAAALRMDAQVSASSAHSAPRTGDLVWWWATELRTLATSPSVAPQQRAERTLMLLYTQRALEAAGYTRERLAGILKHPPHSKKARRAAGLEQQQAAPPQRPSSIQRSQPVDRAHTTIGGREKVQSAVLEARAAEERSAAILAAAVHERAGAAAADGSAPIYLRERTGAHFLEAAAGQVHAHTRRHAGKHGKYAGAVAHARHERAHTLRQAANMAHAAAGERIHASLNPGGALPGTVPTHDLHGQRVLDAQALWSSTILPQCRADGARAVRLIVGKGRNSRNAGAPTLGPALRTFLGRQPQVAKCTLAEGVLHVTLAR